MRTDPSRRPAEHPGPETDHAQPTQQQGELDRRRSIELSRQRTTPPAEIPGYETRQFLGAGAYGEVWVAVDLNTGRRVAIKFFSRPNAVDWSLLSREVEKLVFLSADRYVVQLLDVGWDATPPFYVMEYIEGGSLQQLLDNRGAMPVGEAVELFREIVYGMLHAHGKGVLHCDLKPANILLDQDLKPRLADFGQSRLSHEQTPALGTLFFMAPEQADLDAVPDARWDVYALGALLHCMLTGEPPGRSEQLLDEIDSLPTLELRLQKYRESIQSRRSLPLYRRWAKVDRELSDIVDRCLQTSPSNRYPNVQSLMTALKTRDANRDRRPLLLLGMLGPLIFLMVLGMYGWSTYSNSVQNSDRMAKRFVLGSSSFAAKFVAETMARRIDQLFQTVRDEAARAELIGIVQEIQADDELRSLLRVLSSSASREEIVAAQQQFSEHPSRQALQVYTQTLIERDRGEVASWFVTDRNGIQLASSFANDFERSTVGGNFSGRTYFHGGREDRPLGRHHDLQPLRQTQLSTVFRSTATGTWKIAVSTPLFAEPTGGKEDQRQPEVVGVVALTVELGRLGDRDDVSSSGDRLVAVVDGRLGPQRGNILQHPLFTQLLAESDRLPNMENYRVDLDQLPTADEIVSEVQIYRDPLARHDAGAAFDREWIAAREEVRLEAQAGQPAFETGLVVVVQEDYEAAAAPIRKLGEVVIRDGVWALGALIAAISALWFVVTRAMRDPNEVFRRSGYGTSSSLPSLETVELPERLRDGSHRSKSRP